MAHYYMGDRFQLMRTHWALPFIYFLVNGDYDLRYYIIKECCINNISVYVKCVRVWDEYWLCLDAILNVGLDRQSSSN